MFYYFLVYFFRNWFNFFFLFNWIDKGIFKLDCIDQYFEASFLKPQQARRDLKKARGQNLDFSRFPEANAQRIRPLPNCYQSKLTLNSLHILIELLLLCEFLINLMKSKLTLFFENHLILKANPGSSDSLCKFIKEDNSGTFLTCRMFEITLAYPMNSLLSTDMKIK